MSSALPSLTEELNLRNHRLSKSHRLIADYINTHYERAQNMTASALAQAVNVSESTVVRFADALGYDGYPELQRALQHLARQRMTTDERFRLSSDLEQDDVLEKVLKEDINNIRRTISQTDKKAFGEAVGGITDAKAIYILGLRSAAPLAQFFAYYLNFIFSDVHLVSSELNDVYESIVRIGRGDVLIGISFPRYSSRTLEALRIARAAGAATIAITDGDESPLKPQADICLTADTKAASFADSLAAPLSLINALIAALALRKKDELHKHLTRMEGIWAEHSVYLGKNGK